MTKHPNSLAFLKYLHNTILEFNEPLIMASWQRPENKIFDIYEGIRAEFFFIAGHFANLDGSVSDSEAAFAQDIQIFLGETNFENYSNQSYREMMQDLIEKYPDSYKVLNVPSEVELLQIYDESQGTDYATPAKAMYFRFANEIVKADGDISEKEEVALSKYKELLFNFRLKGELEEQPKNQTLNEISFERKTKNQPKNLENLLNELGSLIGLDKVKMMLLNSLIFSKSKKCVKKKEWLFSRSLVILFSTEIREQVKQLSHGFFLKFINRSEF